jgi:hypothetical protein
LVLHKPSWVQTPVSYTHSLDLYILKVKSVYLIKLYALKMYGKWIYSHVHSELRNLINTSGQLHAPPIIPREEITNNI